MPDEWEKAVRNWTRINQHAKAVVKGKEVPDRNDEYFLYQTLVGSFPLAPEGAEFVDRLKAYMIKAVREAKVHTEWLRPDEAYEQAFMAYIDEIVKPVDSNRFLNEFIPFIKTISYHGMLNTLSQSLVKIFSPGIPDFYQGTELWDLSFVDPDNRRPVDFAARAGLLKKMRQEESRGSLNLGELLDHWEDGRIKLYLTCKALQFRNSREELFFDGDYIPLKASGAFRRHVCAFARQKRSLWSVVLAPRFTTEITAPGKPPAGGEVWGVTTVLFPENAPDRWVNVLTGEHVEVSRAGKTKQAPAEQIFQTFPVAVLEPVP
jgi:(1->4)-alpha-D-glucan 1-alpha-D-glucosylmutase